MAFGGSSPVEVEVPPNQPSLAARCLMVLLRGYKLLVSPLFVGSCRFQPSCSQYASDAIRLHGAVGGGWLAVRRLARCHPLCRGGYDPLPSQVSQTAAAGQRART